MNGEWIMPHPYGFSAFIGTILYALYARVPYVQATGMGLVAFFSYTVILNMGYTYHQALAIIFISGLVCLILTVGGIRNAMVTAIPDCVKNAMSAGIGLFITIIGLKNAGPVVPNASTLVSLVNFAQWRVPEADTTGLRGALVALIGLVIIGALQAKRVKGNILIGIIASTLIGIPLGVTNISNIDLNIAQKFVDFVDVSFLKMDFAGLATMVGKVGCFEAGYEMDAVVLDDSRLEHPQDLDVKSRLERMIYFSDDQEVCAKYVKGVKIYEND